MAAGGWEECTENVLSGYPKSYGSGSSGGTAAPSVGRKSPRQGAKAALMTERCQQSGVTDESNNGAPYPALIT